MKTVMAVVIVSIGSGVFMWPRASAFVQAAQSSAAVQMLPAGKESRRQPRYTKKARPITASRHKRRG